MGGCQSSPSFTLLFPTSPTPCHNSISFLPQTPVTMSSAITSAVTSTDESSRDSTAVRDSYAVRDAPRRGRPKGARNRSPVSFRPSRSRSRSRSVSISPTEEIRDLEQIRQHREQATQQNPPPAEESSSASLPSFSYAYFQANTRNNPTVPALMVNSDDSTESTDSDATAIVARHNQLKADFLQDTRFQRHGLQANLKHQTVMITKYETEMKMHKEAISAFKHIPEIDKAIEQARKSVELAKKQLTEAQAALTKVKCDNEQYLKDRRKHNNSKRKVEELTEGIKEVNTKRQSIKDYIDVCLKSESREHLKKEIDTDMCCVCQEEIEGVPVSLIHTDFAGETDKYGDALQCMQCNGLHPHCRDEYIQKFKKDTCPYCKLQVILSDQVLLQ